MTYSIRYKSAPSSLQVKGGVESTVTLTMLFVCWRVYNLRIVRLRYERYTKVWFSKKHWGR